MTEDKIEQLKRDSTNKYIEYSNGNCDQCSYEAVSWVINYLNSRGLIVQLDDVEWLEEDLRMPVDSYNGAVLKAARLYLELLGKQKGK